MPLSASHIHIGLRPGVTMAPMRVQRVERPNHRWPVVGGVEGVGGGVIGQKASVFLTRASQVMSLLIHVPCFIVLFYD